MNRSDDLFSQPGGTPDPYWQRAFDEASDSPPPRVWEGVERQLDLDESDGILPLWQHREGRRSMLFGRWAAGIAASLLLTALGWWAWHREDALRPEAVVARSATPASAATTAEANSPTRSNLGGAATKAMALTEATRVDTRRLPQLALRPDGPNRLVARRVNKPNESIPTLTGADAVALNSSLDAPIAAAPARVDAVPDSDPVAGMSRQSLAARPVAEAESDENGALILTQTVTSTTIRLRTNRSLPTDLFTESAPIVLHTDVTRSVTMHSFRQQSIAGGLMNPTQRLLPGAPGGVVIPTTMDGFLKEELPITNPTTSLALTSKAVAPREIAATERETKSVETAAKSITRPVATASKKRRERPWLSAGVLASTFNPGLLLRSVFGASASMVQGNYTNAGTTSALSFQNQPGRAVAFQAGIGIPLGDHWSIESGVGYLNGQSQLQSPARITSLALPISSAMTSNLYTDLVSRLTSYPVTADVSNKLYDNTLVNQAGSYSSSQQQVVSNNYQFVQVPVQVGYELRPRRKFGLALLTGLVSNWFVRNTVAETITVKPGDGLYRPVTLAGTAGLRLRYRPDHQWSASVAGTVQHSLQSLTPTDASVQAQPQQVGVSFSVDRHF